MFTDRRQSATHSECTQQPRATAPHSPQVRVTVAEVLLSTCMSLGELKDGAFKD